jgi:hypothetical protein
VPYRRKCIDKSPAYAVVFSESRIWALQAGKRFPKKKGE